MTEEFQSTPGIEPETVGEHSISKPPSLFQNQQVMKWCPNTGSLLEPSVILPNAYKLIQSNGVKLEDYLYNFYIRNKSKVWSIETEN